jgi:Lrp/AsnC family transcriptional regulator for asnA, asnC and gidA
MDELDIEIVEILQRNARTKFGKIAKTLNVGIDTVTRRYENLIRKGIIGAPTIIIDAKLCGFEGLTDYLIKLKPGTNAEKVQAKLNKLDGVVVTALTLGEIDLYLSTLFRNHEHFVDTYKRIKQIEEISNVELLLYELSDWNLPMTFEDLMEKPVGQKSIIRFMLSSKKQ